MNLADAIKALEDAINPATSFTIGVSGTLVNRRYVTAILAALKERDALLQKCRNVMKSTADLLSAFNLGGAVAETLSAASGEITATIGDTP